ncbi:hypothetical protein I8748_33935 [Nostoc sp. CENA67]|uniref:DUF6745 domain-containing protein n=1 Tax=Amazonocrinis nigriterrae CENA67 TaxID=2794033 RepID=A0A8J7I1D3_9NOST|nr:hypothetical protein [Amazonocrinis nigriterrae]MBH8567093.1 hypothetical protein [Amazonocrinis nigriterrae CENA67]
MSLIDKLTPQQEALIPIYWEKWRKIALSTERIDRDETTQAIKIAYAAISKSEPEIIFCNSPYASLEILSSKQVETNLCKELINYIFPKLTNKNREVSYQIDRQLINQLRILPLDYISLQYLSIDKLKVKNRLETNLDTLCLKSQSFASTCCWVDFYISVLDCSYSQIRWLILQSIAKYCGWIWPYEKVCIVCDRPLHLRFDNQNRLHAEGEPAIEFTDGYSLYSYHGVTLPEKYGKIHPQQWQATWLLSEKNAELRRVLIQGIGYARICQELQAVELDTWAEYILLKIDADVDSEPIYLLKMTCPSTGLIYVLRVPPAVESARKAIRWINWGIDPEDFFRQT